MLLAAAILLAAKPDLNQALAWADRLYREAGSVETGFDVWLAERALEAYRQVARKYPESEAARLGVARGLSANGDFAAAVREFGKVSGNLVYHEVVGMQARLDIQRELQGKLKSGDQVFQVLPLNPSLNFAWVALTGHREVRGPDDPWPEFTRAGITLVRPDGTEKRLRLTGGSDADYPSDYVTIRLGSLAGGPFNLLIVAHHFPGADNNTSHLEVLDLGSGGKAIGKFSTTGGYSILTLGKPAHTVIEVVPTWKVWWNDLVEWRDGRFRMATREHPEHYWKDYLADVGPLRRWPGKVREISYWLRRGARCAIQRRFREAAIAYRRAADLCLKARQGKYKVIMWEGWGELDQIQREIRQRLVWLRQKDYSHDLLYRPYNLDWPTPPR